MDFTKKAIMQEFSQLLDEKPMNKITIKDIVGRCNISRNTFYYHFQDIPALFEQMMEEKTDQLLQKHYQPNQPIECINPMLEYGLSHKRAVLHVYRAVPQETFLGYINRITQHFVEEYITNATAGQSIPAETVDVTIHFYRCAIVGLLLDWLDAGMNYDALALSRQICSLFEGTGKMALSRRTE